MRGELSRGHRATDRCRRHGCPPPANPPGPPFAFRSALTSITPSMITSPASRSKTTALPPTPTSVLPWSIVIVENEKIASLRRRRRARSGVAAWRNRSRPRCSMRPPRGSRVLGKSVIALPCWSRSASVCPLETWSRRRPLRQQRLIDDVLRRAQLETVRRGRARASLAHRSRCHLEGAVGVAAPTSAAVATSSRRRRIRCRLTVYASTSSASGPAS